MVEPLVVSPSGVDAIALGDSAAFEHNGVLVQYEGIGAGEVGRSLAFVRDPRFVGTGFFAGEAPDGLTTVYGDPIPADVFVYWRDPDDPMAQEVLVGATKSAPDGTWRITGLNYNLQYVVRARASGRDDVTVVGVQPARSDVIAYVNQLVPREDEFGDVDGLTGYVLLDSGLPPFTCEVIQPLPYGLTARIEGRKLLIEGVSSDNGFWESVVRVTASNGVWVDVPVQVQIQVLTDPHWDKVVTLLHFDGDLTDETGASWSAIGSHSFASGRFDDAAMLPGTAYNYFVAAASTKYDLPGDFTIEAFVKPSSLIEYDTYLSRQNDSGGNIALQMRLNNGVPEIVMRGYRTGVVTLSSAGGAITTGAFTHIAAAREDGYVRLFVNGVIQAAGACSFDLTHFGGARHLLVGGSDGNSPGSVYSYHGAIDELRITKGIARYTENFTPPINPFPSR